MPTRTTVKVSLFLDPVSGRVLWMVGTSHEAGPAYDGVAASPEEGLVLALRAIGYETPVGGAA